MASCLSLLCKVAGPVWGCWPGWLGGASLGRAETSWANTHLSAPAGHLAKGPEIDRPRQRPVGPTYYTLSTRTSAWPEALAHR